MPGPLAGIRVLDFTHALAGPFGTMILTDMGAEVINIERIEDTNESRGHGPYVNGRSTFRFSVERGKKGMQLDLKSPKGVDIALRLADRSDVVAENFGVGTMDKLGLGYGVISGRNPRIIYASCTGFGQTGPYAERGSLDLVAQAMSGFLSITGEPGGRPMRAGVSFGDMLGGTWLAMGVLSAMYDRERTGLGQRVDVSMLESMVYYLENAIIRYSATGEVPQRIGPRHPLSTPFQPFEASDGWIVVAGVRDWEAFCVVIGRDDLGPDPQFQTAAGRNKHHAFLEPIFIEAFRKKPVREWLTALEGVCIASPVYTVPEMIHDPHVQARKAIVELPVPGPEKRTVMVPCIPARLSRTPPEVNRPGPAVGEHTVEVLRDILGMSLDEIRALEAERVVKGT